MDDKDYIRAYSVSIYMLALLDEYGKLGRLGAFAKVYNTIVKKNSVFQKQINELLAKKRKKISYKAELFFKASNISIKTWDKTIKETKGLSISVGSTLLNLYRLNEETISKVYGLKMSDFQKIGKFSQAGVTFNSCRMSRVLTENTTLIEELVQIKQIELKDTI